MGESKSFILVINSGSATLKFKIFQQSDFRVAVSGIVEKIGLPGSFFDFKIGSKNLRQQVAGGIGSHQQALQLIFSRLAEWRPKIGVIGHRVVHGGQDFTAPTLINPSILTKLEKYNRLAPLHNPINLACIRACQKVLPGRPNIAVFDTAFYKTIPDYDYLYAIPLKYYRDLGIRRYGFHGISHQYVAASAAAKIGKSPAKLNLVTCHLGSGCSITAVKKGKAVATSMGFTPLAGLMMGTRCGDLDPAVPLFLQSHLKITPAEVGQILNNKSGLRGIFGYSNDLRDIMLASGYKVAGYCPPKVFSAAEKSGPSWHWRCLSTALSATSAVIWQLWGRLIISFLPPEPGSATRMSEIWS